MNSIVVSSIIFASVFASALVGMAVRRALPEDHVGSDAKEVVRLATGLIATMAALVLGMLVSSAKSSYDARKNEVAEMSSEVLAIDRSLAKFGQETGEIRTEFRQMVQAGLDRIWPSQSSRQAELRPGNYSETALNELELLAPKDDRQAAAKVQAISMVVSLKQSQWLMFLKSEQNAVPLPLLVILVLWLAAIFVSFGLFAPPNPTVVVTLALSALAVSSAMFLILEMYTPFSGVLRIAPTPILDALSQMGH
ncbi:hypothetical protein [Tunturiibacter gelidiferens]|uniref:bestrophin-like domain n=1 Tax=Tunturiibacter gelidiferens TaxID=3069689 RepID=UPI003D9BA803